MSENDPPRGMAPRTDWDAWHRPYDDPHSDLSRRLVLIQDALTTWLDATAPEKVRLLSVCAGDGRDVIEVLRDRPDAPRAQVTLLEQDPRNAERARDAVRSAGLGSVVVRECDAGQLAAWQGAGPFDLVLLAGVFGNISDADVRATVEALPIVCAAGAVVVWTRHRRAPDLTGQIRRCLGEAGFEEESFTAPSDAIFSVGVNRYALRTVPVADPSGTLFTFIRGAAHRAPRATRTRHILKGST